MKKVVAILLLSILLVSTFAPAFAKPEHIICPVCDRGELISITQTPWQHTFDFYVLYSKQYDYCYETIKCTAGTHGPYYRERNVQYYSLFPEYDYGP